MNSGELKSIREAQWHFILQWLRSELRSSPPPCLPDLAEIGKAGCRNDTWRLPIITIGMFILADLNPDPIASIDARVFWKGSLRQGVNFAPAAGWRSSVSCGPTSSFAQSTYKCACTRNVTVR